MTDNRKKILTVVCILILLAIASLYLVIGSGSAKITTFEECEKAGWLVRSITVYDGTIGSPEKKCELWGGKSFIKQGIVQSDNVSVLSVSLFPVQKEPATTYMQALLSDKPEELIIKDGCLRAGGYLLVWPYGYTLSTDGKIIQIIDNNGQPIMRVGDKIKVGGGADETPDGRVVKGYSAQLPDERCSGPYWIIGEVIAVDKSTSPVATIPTLKSAPSQYLSGQAFDEASGILTKKWDAGNFAGFWRDPEINVSTESLLIDQVILNNSYRVIEKHNLIYTTKSIPVKYQVYVHANQTPSGTEGFYSAVGWLGEEHMYLQGNRLAKIVFEQNATEEEKEMTVGESWKLGEGYKIIANSISAKDTGGRQAWITLFKDSNKLVDTVMVQYGPNKFFTYQMNLSDGTPNFMIYYSRVDSLQYSDAAYFKYTWLRSQNFTDIKEGDVFGIMEVTSIKNDTIELRNKEPIDLISGNTIRLMGDIGIQVNSSKTGLLFYPIKGGV